ncbi:MAG: acyl-CoA/acyl-ACP dehydrogenase [Nocardiopsaceae bacterium]|nr:acyl-CoA/acyl-ACP dehydrogenase [Nocardiopsaceae bacterium]
MNGEALSLPLVEAPETRELRQTVRTISEKYGHDYFVRTSRDGASPTELWAELGRAGLLGVNVPEEYGGGGGGMTELAVITEELAASGIPLMLMALSPAVCATTLLKHGSAELRRRWLPQLASGEAVMAFAITEPDAGSNAHRIRTRAVRDGAEWVVSGSKYYVSHIDNADAILVVAKTGEPDERGRHPLSLFVMDVDAPNLGKSEIPVEITSPERQFSLSFDDVRLPAEALVGAEGKGLAALFSGLNPERIGSAALLNGIARYALDKAARYARERTVWDVPIGAHQGIAHPLAKAHVEVEGARLMAARAAAMYDAGLAAAGAAANMAKFAASEAASHALDAAIQTHGGNGMATEYGLATLSGLVRLFRIAPVSTEMILNHIAQHELDLPKSY